MSNKSIAQRLQSRISIRRNIIRDMEDHRAKGKVMKLLARAYPDQSNPEVIRFHKEYEVLKNTLRELAEEQKLDKDLFHRYVCPLDSAEYIFGSDDELRRAVLDL